MNTVTLGFWNTLLKELGRKKLLMHILQNGWTINDMFASFLSLCPKDKRKEAESGFRDPAFVQLVKNCLEA